MLLYISRKKIILQIEFLWVSATKLDLFKIPTVQVEYFRSVVVIQLRILGSQVNDLRAARERKGS